LESAVLASHLRELPADVLDDLMAGAVRLKIPAGSVIHREGEGAPHLKLVVSGIVRAFVSAPDGRTMTVRYCRPGALLGVMSLFTPGFAMPAWSRPWWTPRCWRCPLTSPVVPRRRTYA
jgi:CRP/FNR family transcriptional regulator, cyclic AMP receptor protein